MYKLSCYYFTGSSDEVLDRSQSIDDPGTPGGRGDKSISQQRSNTTVHVCWHRATSVTRKAYSLATQVTNKRLPG